MLKYKEYKKIYLETRQHLKENLRVFTGNNRLERCRGCNYVCDFGRSCLIKYKKLNQPGNFPAAGVVRIVICEKIPTILEIGDE